MSTHACAGTQAHSPKEHPHLAPRPAGPHHRRQQRAAQPISGVQDLEHPTQDIARGLVGGEQAVKYAQCCSLHGAGRVVGPAWGGQRVQLTLRSNRYARVGKHAWAWMWGCGGWGRWVDKKAGEGVQCPRVGMQVRWRACSRGVCVRVQACMCACASLCAGSWANMETGGKP